MEIQNMENNLFKDMPEAPTPPKLPKYFPDLQGENQTTMENNLLCEKCGKEFKNKEDLDMHMQENHPTCQCTSDSVCDSCLD